MRAALERLAALPYDEVVLWTFEENARAIAFYERHGWRPDGAEKIHPRDRGSPPSGYRRPVTMAPYDRHLRREALADPALRAGDLARRRQGQGGDPRRGQARVERVALPAAPRRWSRRSPARPRTSTAIRTPRRGRCDAPSRTITRPTRPGSPSPTAPARSCSRPRWLSASPATRSSTPGRRSRSTRTCRRSRARARSGCRSAEGYVHDLDAMLEEVTAATQLLIVCNPNNPTGTHLPFDRIGAFVESVPSQDDDHPRRGLRRVPDQRRPGRDAGSARQAPERRPAPDLQQVPRARGPARRATRSAPRSSGRAVDAVRQPFSVNALAQAAAAEAIRHQDDVADRVEKNLSSGSSSRRRSTSWASPPPTRRPTSPGSSWATCDEGEVVASLSRAGVAVRPGTPLGGPGCLRVTYGTRAENERFLAAMGEIAG